MKTIPDYIIEDAIALADILEKGRLDDATYIISAAKRLVRDLINQAKEEQR